MEWNDVIARSKRIPPKGVKDRLKISYDALEYDQKQIFLDIACFFSAAKSNRIYEKRACFINDFKKSNASYMWEACEWYPTYGLAVLSSMSLIKIKRNNEIWMHDQLKDLGRDIVCEECVKDPKRRSRLCVQKEALKVLFCKEGKEMVEALSLREPMANTLTYEHFSSFQSLRFLEVAGVQMEGDFANLLGKLVCLSWHKCPSNFYATNFYLENLVILDLSHSFIDENWGGWSLIQVGNNLKVLDLKHCHNLTTTPDFSYNDSLETLDLCGCSKLEEIGSSIGKLRSLKYIDLRYCYSLRGLPEEFGLLHHLKQVPMSGSKGTFSLPKSFGHLTSLVALNLEKFQISELPQSLGNLELLVELHLKACKISQLPDSIGGLVNLRTLDLSYCSELKELPHSIGKLESLDCLYLQGTSVCSLPDSIGDLQELKAIFLNGCKIKKLPRSIGRLRNLERLYADGCQYLAEIPMEIGQLLSLRELMLSGSSISILPSSITQLTLLQKLDLEGNKVLHELPSLPSSLTSLYVSSNMLPCIPNLSKLNNLTDLMLLDIHCVGDGIENLTKLKYLNLGLSNAPTLFNLGPLTRLETLCLSFQDTATCTESLSFATSEFLLRRTKQEMSLPPLSNLKNLSSLRFRNFLMKDGLPRLGIRELGMLKRAWIYNCSYQLIEICLAESLVYLRINDCKSLETLPDLTHLKALKILHIDSCKNLREIPGLEKLESLGDFAVGQCDSLQRLGNLSLLRKLWRVYLFDCPKLKCIEGIDAFFVEYLAIYNCELLENIEELKKRCKVGSFNDLRFENYC